MFDSEVKGTPQFRAPGSCFSQMRAVLQNRLVPRVHTSLLLLPTRLLVGALKLSRLEINKLRKRPHNIKEEEEERRFMTTDLRDSVYIKATLTYLQRRQ